MFLMYEGAQNLSKLAFVHLIWGFRVLGFMVKVLGFMVEVFRVYGQGF